MRFFLRTLRMALNALRRNVMRSALTTLGIVIGIAAVIAMMEIGQGSSTAVQRTIQSMGADNLLVQPGTATSGGVSFGSGSVMTLTPQDAEALARECPAVSSVAPVVRARTTGATLSTAGHSRLMASASWGVRVMTLPEPKLTPPLAAVPG